MEKMTAKRPGTDSDKVVVAASLDLVDDAAIKMKQTTDQTAKTILNTAKASSKAKSAIDEMNEALAELSALESSIGHDHFDLDDSDSKSLHEVTAQKIDEVDETVDNIKLMVEKTAETLKQKAQAKEEAAQAINKMTNVLSAFTSLGEKGLNFEEQILKSEDSNDASSEKTESGEFVNKEWVPDDSLCQPG